MLLVRVLDCKNLVLKPTLRRERAAYIWASKSGGTTPTRENIKWTPQMKKSVPIPNAPAWFHKAKSTVARLARFPPLETKRKASAAATIRSAKWRR